MSGTRAEQAFERLSTRDLVSDWSRDGRYLIEDLISAETGRDIWVIPQFGDRKPFPFLRARYNEGFAKLSPDGQWLAYVSDESRSNEVYVQRFPEHNGKWQISSNGGNWPVWSRDGRELYFITADRKMMAAEIKLGGGQFEPGAPKPLFQLAQIAEYDVSKDGRFLIQVPVDQGTRNVPITVVTNWQAALKK
jgi:Tol biopolymer transport system component